MSFAPFYDRQGKPCSMEEWARDWEQHRRVKETTLPSGLWVSTIFLGIDHGCGMLRGGVPIIYETMVFRSEADLGEVDMMHYATEGEALAGHEVLCAYWSTHSPDEPRSDDE